MNKLSRAISKIFFSTIRKKLIFSFLFVIILPIACSSIISSVMLQNAVKEKVNLGNEMALTQICLSIERVYKDMIIASNTLMLDDEILDILKHKQSTDQNLFYNQRVMDGKFFNVQTSTLDSYTNHFIAVLPRNGGVYTTLQINSFYDNSTFVRILDDESLDRKNNYVKLADKSHLVDFPALGKIRYIVLARAYMEFTNGGKIGDVMIGIPESYMSDILKALGANNGIKGYIVSDEGEIITATNQADIGTKLKYYSEIKSTGTDNISMLELSKNDCIINSRYIEKLGWRVVEEIPNSFFFDEMAAGRRTLIYINLIFIFAFLGVAYFIANSISKPISNLDKATSEISSGNLEARVEVLQSDELGQLSVKFNNMAVQIKELFNKVNEEQKTKRELEMKMLYAQINPHFLFNTLNSIRWMADASRVFNVSKSIVALTNLLRNSIIKTDELITIADEIENIKNYVTLQKLRNASLFEDEYDIDEEILRYRTLKLILQPIVENSIIHGFEGIQYKGIIKIRGYSEEGKIIILISDNGTGMEEEKIKTLMSSNYKSKGRFNGIGLSNVNERLILHFGNEYALKIVSKPGVGMTTTVILPILSEEGVAGTNV